MRPDEAIMVATHAYSLGSAQILGMRTDSVYCWTVGRGEDINAVRMENSIELLGEVMRVLLPAVRSWVRSRRRVDSQFTHLQYHVLPTAL
ncbi:uncharacterized protein GGS22DRAFT_151200 [Annulohypoxylon maeteangense]|uniref:uncharacterized protein n=1 Tax=Annulohypoxylon maeteangense TaxID=1927788 RepID=UPI00200812F3|nr:uncharacterized protein GGS22DRAFT_151200 [Annulohypoxylon maeteangense]KAI0890546.1 hypothetical protein GGS22DRAFT_151200 [Annulohypoxylon maeteangense]